VDWTIILIFRNFFRKGAPLTYEKNRAFSAGLIIILVKFLENPRNDPEVCTRGYIVLEILGFFILLLFDRLLHLRFLLNYPFRLPPQVAVWY
jgi:hypothetical protein